MQKNNEESSANPPLSPKTLPIQQSKKKTKSIQYNSMFAYWIEVLTSDKPELEKIKAWILLEQDFQILQEQGKIFTLFKLFEKCWTQSEFVCSILLKGQIIITATTWLILWNCKNTHSIIFTNFIDNIWIEQIKTTNNISNLYLRQVSCHCLEELEKEYPGIMFNLMGKRIIEIFENHQSTNYTNQSMTNQNEVNSSETNSIKSYSVSRRNGANSVFSSKTDIVNQQLIPNFEYKKNELLNEGLYILIEDEKHYVFQFYLSWYSLILKHMIQYYIYHNQFINGDEYKQYMIQNNWSKDADTDNNNPINANNVDNKDYSKYFDVFSNFPYIKSLINSIPWQSPSISSHVNEMNIPFTFISINYNHLNMPKRTNTILHWSNFNYNRYIILYQGFKTFEENNKGFPKGTCGTQLEKNKTTNNETSEYIDIHQEFQVYINKALSRIIHLLPKTTEVLKCKIWKLLGVIIAKININQSALLPHFNYFHLNINSCILTWNTIQIIKIFRINIKHNFILKLVIKLCLLINDIRLHENIRVIVIRWLNNLKNSNKITFNFEKNLMVIAYYLVPTPFDSLIVVNEKIKSWFLFFENFKTCTNDNGCSFIMNSISIMDSYKYYPIFSKHIKSLFRAYLSIIIKYPYKNNIMNISKVLRNNLKEIPRILSNEINLFRIVHSLCDSKVWTEDNICDKDNQEIMSFKAIYKLLLMEMSNFIGTFNSSSRWNNYFELFWEIAKHTFIEPTNIINGLSNWYKAIKGIRNWKIEQNIWVVCKHWLQYQNIETIKNNNWELLWNDIYRNSFDYGIREKAKMYYELLRNTEKQIWLKFLTNDNNLNQCQIGVNYDYKDYDTELSKIIKITQTKEERIEGMLNDRGTSIINCGCNSTNLLLSNCYCMEGGENEKYLWKENEVAINYEKWNDYVNKEELNRVINNVLQPDDILRLFIDNDNINDNKEGMIDIDSVFTYENTNNCIINNDNKKIEFHKGII